jgi:hypothetical protein
MNIQPGIIFLIAKNVLMGGMFYYFGGPNSLMWWLAWSGVFYGLLALNLLMGLEQKLDQKFAELEKRISDLGDEYAAQLANSARSRVAATRHVMGRAPQD